MKLLVLSHTSEMIGGAERSMLDLFDYWSSEYSLRPEFILREPLGAMVGEMDRRKWRYYPLQFSFWSWPKPPTEPAEIRMHAMQNRRAVKKVEKLIQKTKPDIVMTNTLVSPWAALAAHGQKVPHVWFVREYGDLDHDRKFELSQRQTFEDIGSMSNLVVANSKTLAQHIEQYVPKAKVAVLYNPFDLKSIAIHAAAKVDSPFKYPNSLKLIMTGNIAHTKGQLDAVKAVAELSRKGELVELCLAGKNVDKEYQQQIEDCIKQAKISDRVHLIGLYSKALALVAQANVGIVASAKEAFGRTTFEFLALGKPVIGANSGGTPEMVEEGVNGYLFTPGNSQKIATVLTKYLKDRSLLNEHGAASRRKAALMMKSNLNADALYKKLQVIVAGQGEPQGPTVHFKFKELSGSISSSIRFQLRQQAKINYSRARKIKARLRTK